MTLDQPTIKPQTEIPQELVLPLDPEVFKPSLEALEFLKKTVSEDEEEIRAKVQEVQKEAYAKHPYPCLRGFHHVALFMSANAIYPRVLELGQSDPEAVLLDIGCCMGTDVRKAVFDGYPAAQIVGCDLLSDFIALGHKLYADGDGHPIRFIQGDVFALDLPSPTQTVTSTHTTSSLSEFSSLNDLLGRVAAIYTGALFHLFDESTQLAMALRLALLIRKDKPSIIFGRHQGLPQAGLIDDHYARVRYGHSPESWPVLWKSVFTDLRGEEYAKDKVTVKAELRATNAGPALTAGGRRDVYMLYWSVEISP
ncbi:hypothetical protein PENSPDRAFT_657361 [Peniophora sp. CONT]|nr:hypothetical protein PENSPDRAFT_657361 [Peniophora sp. CONT]